MPGFNALCCKVVPIIFREVARTSDRKDAGCFLLAMESGEADRTEIASPAHQRYASQWRADSIPTDESVSGCVLHDLVHRRLAINRFDHNHAGRCRLLHVGPLV